MPKEVVVALAGNPNSGKTTVFNNLTGARQHVGNWPGVTVEKKEGICRWKGRSIRIVDLPGVYSLTAYSPDEVVARNFIVEEKPDAVVDVVDASNLERNLYLVVQLLEMGAPLIVALNMMDEADSRGYRIDVERLSQLIRAPVVPMEANRNRGTQGLLDEIAKVTDKEIRIPELIVNYGQEVEEEITKLESRISSAGDLARRYPPRWLAVKLLEKDQQIVEVLKAVEGG